VTIWSVQRHANAHAFLDRAGPWLLRAEAENNLILGIAAALAADGATDAWLATVEHGSDVVGCAFRTPPWKIGLTRMPQDALPALVDAVRHVYGQVPGVLAPEPTARQFAEAWQERTGQTFRSGMRQRIYQLDRVVPIERQVDGSLRPARPADVPLLVAWSDAFFSETGIPARDSSAAVAEWMRRDALFVWDVDGEPRSMAGRSAETPNGVRVGYVYTPPEHRGRGYASTCTAALSQLMLDSGRRFCFLYTDVANATSNRIYRDIGYEPVIEAGDYWFT
jgi:predicted GNAT family acetyltransferase